ncbi:hypothetical protein L9F63_005161, partial [Diploptera punctata]
FKGEAFRTIMEFILNYGLKDVNIFELFGVDKYMSAFGLLVLREFRGQGISVQLLKARFPLGKALGLTATMTFFSPTAAQVAAEKAGMRVHKQVEYEDYKVNGKVVFPNLKSSVFKFSGKTPMSDGKIPKFRIQCITEDMFEEILADDPVSLGEMKEIWLKFLKQKVGMVAIMEEEGEQEGKRHIIAGFNITGVTTISDKLTVDMIGEKQSYAKFATGLALQ